MEGTVLKSGSKRHLRFGSQAFASQGLSSEEQQALSHACQQQGADKVISVLVDTASETHTSDLSRSHSHSNSSTAADQHSELSPRQAATADGSDESQQTGTSQNGNADNQIWVFAFEDTVHQRSAEALEDLREGSWVGRGNKQKRLRVMMLTGDNEASAQRVAKQLNIQEVRAGLSPEQKLQVQTFCALHRSQDCIDQQGPATVSSSISSISMKLLTLLVLLSNCT